MASLLPEPGHADRRGVLEDLVDELLSMPAGGDDPRVLVNVVTQGTDGGLNLAAETAEATEEMGENEDPT
jgi:hypothetical protein